VDPHPDPGNVFSGSMISIETIFSPLLMLLIRYPEFQIRDAGWKKAGSGINIQDPKHWEKGHEIKGF
jgi:hypothetical protein